MKVFNKKLNQAGFTHVEMLLSLIVLLAIGSISWYVVKHQDSSHAGSYNWTYMGEQSAFTVAKNGVSGSAAKMYACKITNNSSSYTVHAKAVLDPTPKQRGNYVFVLEDTSTQGVILDQPNTSTWTSGNNAIAYLGYPVKRNVLNLIQPYVSLWVGGVQNILPSPSSMVTPLRAGQLNKC